MPKLNRYRITFSGKVKGAIGIAQYIEAEVEAFDIPGAVLLLYDRFEHIHVPKVRVLDENGQPGPNAYDRDGKPFLRQQPYDPI